MRTLATIAGLMLIAVGPLSAQDGDRHRSEHGRMMGTMGMTHDMSMMQARHGTSTMGGAQVDPRPLLQMRDSLELTDEQVERLEALAERVRTQVRPHMHEAMAARREAAGLLEAENPDLDVSEAGVREAMNRMVLGHTAMAEVGVEARGTLTAD